MFDCVVVSSAFSVLPDIITLLSRVVITLIFIAIGALFNTVQIRFRMVIWCYLSTQLHANGSSLAKWVMLK